MRCITTDTVVWYGACSPLITPTTRVTHPLTMSSIRRGHVLDSSLMVGAIMKLVRFTWSWKRTGKTSPQDRAFLLADVK